MRNLTAQETQLAERAD